MSAPLEASRRDKILDAAENAFADLGFEGASLRNIVLEADVNLATVYYYFGSKEGLMAAVFKRRFDPLKQEQLERLRRFAPQGDQPLSVEGILEAILVPPLRLTEGGTPKSQMATRLIGRIVSEPNPQTQELLNCQHNEVRQIYIAAFQRVLPDLPLQDLHWRLEFIWGALAMILCNPKREGRNELGGPVNLPNALPQMISFFAAGLRASVAKPTI